MFENDYAPADLILLDTSLTMNKENVAYVSTKVIDGKKNLVTKKCPKITACIFFLFSNFKSGLEKPNQAILVSIVKIFLENLNMIIQILIWMLFMVLSV